MKKFSKITFLILIILMIFINTSFNVNAVGIGGKTTGLYLWGFDNINYSSFSKLVDNLDIGTLYIGGIKVGRSKNFYEYKNNLLFKFAESKNLKSYVVYDEYELYINSMKELVDYISEYNRNNSYNIEGIAVDSEFHVTDEYRAADDNGKKEIFKNYVDSMTDVHNYASSKGVKLVACIPVWYEKVSEDNLERLIRDGCDYVQLMNYSKNNAVKNIETEVNFAKKYNKPIESICEFMKPGTHDVVDSMTYYNDNLSAPRAKFQELENTYNYNKLSYAYHYYNVVLEVAEREIDFNEYNYIINPLDEDGNSLDIDNVYLEGNNEKIKGIKLLNENTNKYELYFYGVDYSKDYMITLDNQNYDLNHTINFSDKNNMTYREEITFREKDNTIINTPATFKTILKSDYVTVEKDSTFTCEVGTRNLNLNGGNGLKEITGTIKYDNKLFKIESVTGLNGWNVVSGNSDDIKLERNDFFTSNGNVVRITFKAIDNTSNSSIKFIDSNNEESNITIKVSSDNIFDIIDEYVPIPDTMINYINDNILLILSGMLSLIYLLLRVSDKKSL